MLTYFILIQDAVTIKPIEIQHLPPVSLKPNPWNTNIVGPEAETKLDASLQEFGCYKPIICRELPDGSLQILGGEHRARSANRIGLPTVPVVNLGPVADMRAKALGLIDNGHYGEDDALKLADLLSEFSMDGLMDLLPYTADDLAGIMAATRIDLDMIGFDPADEATHGLPTPGELPPRAAITHELMRFKVPVADRERVEKLVQHVINTSGFGSESDSLVAVGMALVVICNAAKASL